MAEPARKYDFDPPRPQDDPANLAPRVDPLGPDPLTTESRDPEAALRNAEYARGTGGSGLMIAAAIVILAAIAFYIFGSGMTETTAPPASPPATATTPGEPAPAPATPPSTQPAQ
ncbi:hypothetical protein SAZ10_09925 [Mesorhizobium sp. BAC0120]|uniref:hypothetical protein n=1 Tax=Mesorhizobium sp. BAC0120 TaxID=3090670 RepID=UPI00298C37F7|nr:hypothetical protein [Mesorhizobium sp. BAC0120]MDW6022080.1 hypothetical protein [Mesorhizobium sp. BAC0120]